MPIYELYHGASAPKLLYNISQNGLTTAESDGKLYFAQYQWTNCLVHGADSQTHESYVVKVRVDIPADANIERTPRSGNPDALIVTTSPKRVIPCEFLEMFVRSGTRDTGFHTAKFIGLAAIEGYLISCYRGPI